MILLREQIRPGGIVGGAMVAGGLGSDTASILARMGRGDHAAFDELVDAFWDPLMRFFWRRVPAPEAEDLTQEVFTSTYRAVRIGRGPARGDTESWSRYLFASARNRLIDHRRRTAARPRLDSLESLFDDERSWTDAIEGGDPTQTSSEQLVSEEENEAIRACMDGLEAVPRAVCQLHFMDGRSKRQIGREMRKPESTIRAILVKALAALRRCLQGKGIVPE